jgi:hypothetical protein
VGDASVNIFSGNISISGTVTITTSAGVVIINQQFSYSGSMSKGRGAYNANYEYSKLSKEDQEVAKLVVSNVYIPANADASKVTFTKPGTN